MMLKVFSRAYWPLGGGLVAQLCPTLCDPMDCSPLGFSVHGIFQPRILAWVVIFFYVYILFLEECLFKSFADFLIGLF